MRVLVREKSGEVAAALLVAELVLDRAVVARLVMLEAEVLDAVGEREQPVVVPEMFDAVDRARFVDETSVRRGEIVGRLHGRVAVGGDVDAMRVRTRGARNRDALEV